MTSSLFRGRPRRARSHISVRVAHAVLGGTAGVVWLVLPGMTTGTDATVAAPRPSASASASAVRSSTAAASAQDEYSDTDLILPVALLGAAGALAAYGYVRRVRRARTRTTPAAGPASRPVAAPDELTDLDEQSSAALVETDNRRHTARAELAFAEAAFGPDAVEPLTRAVEAAEAELAAAFRIRQRYDEGVPEETASRRHALAGVLGRCQEARSRLDAEAAALRELRGPDPAEALPVAEARFRELAARVPAAEAILVDLRARYGPTASATAIGYVEQAKDRLVLATTRLNQSRQAADSGQPEDSSRHLRAAEDAIAQAGVFVEGVARLAGHLDEAARLVPAALTGAETELAGLRTPLVREGETYSQLLHADAVLASVRLALTARRPYDPTDLLRRVVRATAPLATGRTGVLRAAAVLIARSSTAAAREFVLTHRGTVAATARTRLTEAERLVATDSVRSDELALSARELAEQDVRLHGAEL
ncbi:hypothetical protein [Streptomyces sp. NPDC018693]|uniref:hypothetical protein n=1 Tax=unclassified Streptomyces TaxID=2593676 RepID=UPI00379857CD